MNDERVTSARVALEGQYEIVRELGLGGTAVVYLARSCVTGEEVAIKLIRATHLEDREALARFAREANVAARLDHPNVVKIRDVLPLGGGRVALVMTRVDGRTLKQLIREEGTLTGKRTEEIIRDVAAGLGAAHAMNIIHRDVKPENIFIDDTGRALLADFGLARSTIVDTQLTLTGVAIGTPTYMSPEQIEGGAVDLRGDIYSLGLVAWEMLNGRRPWDGASLYALLYHQKHDYLPDIREIREDVPDRLADVIAASIEKNPDLRWQSVAELIAALDGAIPSRRAGVRPILASDTIRVARRALPPAPPPAAYEPEDDIIPRRRNRFLVPLAAVATLVIGAAGVFGLHAWLDSKNPYATANDVSVSSGGDVRVVPQSSQPALDSQPAKDSQPSRISQPPQTPQPSQTAQSLNSAPAVVAPHSDSTAPRMPSGTRNATIARIDSSAMRVPASQVNDASRTGASTAVTAARSIIVAGGTHTCLIAAAGRGYCWGANSLGQLGTTGGGRAATPSAIDSNLELTAVAAGLSHSCALVRGGAAWCWGDNDRGQLGDRSNAARAVPAAVGDAHVFHTIAAGAAHTCAIDMAGVAWCWGAGNHGQLGDGLTKDVTVPNAVRTGRYSTIATGWNFTCGLEVSGRALCWGDNSAGQLGTRDSLDRTQPAAVADGLVFVAIAAGSAHACGITAQGDAYCWGKNSNGQLGDGTTSDRVAPTRVKANAHFKSIAAGAVHTCAIDGEGQAYCWGLDSYGQLGDGGSGRQVAPVHVAGDHGFSSLRAFGSHTCGTTLSGEAFCWGYNLDGQLGDGTRVNRSRPVYLEPPIGK